MRLAVHFMHGLESGPGGHKARYLAERFETRTPDMHAGGGVARLQSAHESIRRSLELDVFRRSVALQHRALVAWKPHVLVGSSFGGAVALELLRTGVWRGPTLLLAQASLLAQRRAGVLRPEAEARLPADVDVLLVHGTRDEVVPVADSRILAASSRRARLVEVDDGHGLESLLEGERLADLVRSVAQPSGS